MKKGDWIVALLLTLAMTGCRKPIRITAPTQPTLHVHSEVRILIDLVNNHRKRVGCKELEWSSGIAEVAQRHSNDMAARNFFSHTNPDGQTPFMRLEAARIRYSKAAENIAAGQTTAQAVMRSWLGSSGHRRNIEDCAFTQHGIGFKPGTRTAPFGAITNTWTHKFVRPRV